MWYVCQNIGEDELFLYSEHEIQLLRFMFYGALETCPVMIIRMYRNRTDAGDFIARVDEGTQILKTVTYDRY